MHGRLRRASLLVLAVLQLEACLKKHLPPEDYGIVETVTKVSRDAGAVAMEKAEAFSPPLTGVPTLSGGGRSGASASPTLARVEPAAAE
jgi:hypothetical protein